MKNRISINRLMAVMLTALVALSACSDDKQGEQQKQPPLVQTFTVSANDQTVVRHFVARVDALSTVDLSFQVAGRINRLAERQGVVIPKGDLLAALEPQDYELSLKQAEASFRKAKSDFERGKQLQQDKYISQSDFDGLETAYENAELAVENARLNIEYTELHAPFDALITNRLVEKFSYVQPNQSVLRVQNINYLRVHVNVPEQLMRYAVEENPVYQAFLEDENGELITNENGKPVSLSYLEHKTEINAATQTYQVTFKLPRLDSMDLLPGMALTARIVVANPVGPAGFWVPLSAVDSSGNAPFAVWLIENDTVHYQPVEVGIMRDDQVQIVSGLQPQTKLVAAGVGSLKDGMSVRKFTNRNNAL
ncbi:efflux RND transporter periplasmic adaptor subunit [Alteromonas confluentis]|uniref:Uncharacterized protein n=1 Tax=Alteromonas confluentis TaxID=1656094 RepID=A0A1E7ZBL3_9ALTE|nr:efflux RND transporter periplasmic adaptor subunit [Alteromonas confluentis]OFC70834.1 hypothetical protein BFC18_10280 [Alteromonas confluentis]